MFIGSEAEALWGRSYAVRQTGHFEEVLDLDAAIAFKRKQGWKFILAAPTMEIAKACAKALE